MSGGSRRSPTEHGVRVAFLFLPYYAGPAEVQERRFYEQYGPVLDAHFVAAHDEWFSDVAHLNHAGAIALTDWLAPQLPLPPAAGDHPPEPP